VAPEAGLPSQTGRSKRKVDSTGRRNGAQAMSNSLFGTSNLQTDELARALLLNEVQGEPTPGGLVDALDRVWDKLFARMSRLIASGGAYAILDRSLSLSKRDYHFVNVVNNSQSSVDFSGLRQQVTKQPLSATLDGLAAIIANYVWLLISLIGEDLTMGQLKNIWPNMEILKQARLIPESKNSQEAGE
jgi:hypothetical protein